MLTALGLLTVLIWLGLVFGWHGFWRADQRLPEAPDPAEWPSVVAVVPARNEAENIEQALSSLAAQDYPGPFSIVLSNDSSEDDTAAIARSLADRLPEGRLAVRDAPPLAPGWAGKMWALDRGVRRAARLKPDVYWFTDADIVHDPDILRRLAAFAQEKKLSLVSQMVRLRCETFWEKLLIPPFIFFFGLLYPFRAVNDPKSGHAGAAGGSILVRREALEAIGGFGAVKGALIDDCALGRAVKRSGRPIHLSLGERSHSLRRYDHLSDVWAMVRRSAYHQLRYSPILLVLTLLGLALTYLAPPLLALGWLVGAPVAASLLGLAAFTLMAVCYSPTVGYHGLAPLWSLSLPLAAFLFGGMTAASALAYHRGRANSWRGRTIGREDTTAF